MTGWQPAQYLRFRRERQQPFYDLMDLIASRQRMRVVDLGCGTGALTLVLHERLGASRTTGIDSSAEMLSRAPASSRGLEFARADIADFASDRGGERFDLVFSNAALHWLPDHPALFSRLTERLAPGGQLAVQVPDNFSWHSHQAALQVAAEAPYRDKLTAIESPSVLRPEEYAQLLYRLGYRDQVVRLNIYPHVLPSRADAVEWAKGSYLTPYRSQLDAADFDEFVNRYREVLYERLPARSDDEPLFFPYRRLLVWGRRPE